MRCWHGWGGGYHYCNITISIFIPFPYSIPPYPQICESRDIRIDGHANLHDHLLAAEKRVANEFARAQRNWLFLVRHVDDL